MKKKLKIIGEYSPYWGALIITIGLATSIDLIAWAGFLAVILSAVLADKKEIPYGEI